MAILLAMASIIMSNEQAQPNKQRINGRFTYLLIGVFVMLVVSGCSASNKSSNQNQQSQPEATTGLSSPQETSINEKSTDMFMYSDAGRNFKVSENQFAVFDIIKPSALAGNSTDCGLAKNMSENKKDEHFFTQLLSGYTPNDMGAVYSFAYDEPSQEGDFKVTVIPNKLGYMDIDQFKNDFDVCSAGEDRYPLLISEDYLLFTAACGTGFDDGSGLPHGCYEMQQIIEPTITLK